ncbi:hypothetical protein QJS10_CPB17g01679 [Acorus calamus]|uniref:Holliday junction resolvase MOC1, chloroplastic n=1 Tax=Acorus calamus TaxID=4465 RepID=A0AAV9CRS6_ACOCL|nr:hypothetical protein QJS10_CPB17g01679 [Acorus calamus]
MVTLQTPPKALINALSATLRWKNPFFPANSSCLRPHPVNAKESRASRVRVSASALACELKENWLDSLSCPFSEHTGDTQSGEPKNAGSELVVGIDPDVSGALSLLRGDGPGLCAQVFDSPHLQILVGKRTRRRLDAKSIVQLIRSFEAPLGTTAYIEQSNPFPQDGKQGWWSGGYNYGLWIGILVASGFSVIPVPSQSWKKHFELAGSSSSKDDSREAASMLFPSLRSHLKRKKDHGRAEALLIAAYGKGLTRNLVSENLVSENLLDECPASSFSLVPQEILISTK